RRWGESRSRLSGGYIQVSLPCFTPGWRPGRSGGWRVVGWKEGALGFFVVDAFEGMIPTDGTRTRHGGPCLNRFEKTLEVGIGRERVVFALANPRGAIEPAPGRHVCGRVGLADDIGASFELIVQDLIVTFGLAPIAVDGVIQTIRRRKLEMDGLSRERAEAGCEEHQPRQH